MPRCNKRMPLLILNDSGFVMNFLKTAATPVHGAQPPERPQDASSNTGSPCGSQGCHARTHKHRKAKQDPLQHTPLETRGKFGFSPSARSPSATPLVPGASRERLFPTSFPRRLRDTPLELLFAFVARLWVDFRVPWGHHFPSVFALFLEVDF